MKLGGKTKFNVIIPTRERADTLYHCLRTVVAQDYDNMNIIVSDNHSQDNTREIVASFADDRINYINTGKRISMSHNWEFALNHVEDGWVTILGDDDGMLHGGLSKIDELVRASKCEAIVSRWCHFTWPNSGMPDAPLVIPMTTGYEVRSGRGWLAKLMKGRAQYVDLPMLYTGGFVDIRAINRARNANGQFILSLIPDVYSAVALASVLDSYIFLRDPVAVAGVSSHSNGASTLGLGQNSEPAKKFFSENNMPFHPLLAGGEKVRSIPILVYESYLQSSHLHQDHLNIKLEDQLGLALSMADPQRNFDDLRNYCKQVAARNGLVMAQIEHNLTSPQNYPLAQRLRALLQSLKQQTVLGQSFGVEDIYGATILACAVVQLEACRGNWKQVMLLRILKAMVRRMLPKWLLRRRL